MEDIGRKIKLIFYNLQKEDVKEATQKFSIIPNKLYTIGRSKGDSDIVIDEKLLSRTHVELIYYNNNKIWIKDLNSRNGTYLNKKRVEPFKDIYFTSKDILSLGSANNNEFEFYEDNEQIISKNTEYEKEKNKNYENYDKIEQKNYPRDYEYNNKKNYIDEYYLNKYRQSSHHANKSHSKSKNERSRSRNSYSKKDNNYKNSSRGRNKEKYEYDYTNKYYETERISNEKYSNKYRDFERRTKSKPLDSKENDRRSEKMEERRARRSKDYKNEEEFSRDKVFLNVDKIERIEKNKDLEDAGFVKCYVSGYMMLNIKK